MESTAQYWKPVWETLETYWKPIREKREGARRRSGTLHLAQAQSNRGRRGRKRDFPDAERLVKRLVARELILSFVPDVEQRLWRTVTRKKYQVRCDRVRLQNQVESLLEEAHIKLSSLVSDLFGLSAQRMLKALAQGETDPAALAALADERLRATPEQLCDALGACKELNVVYRRLVKMALEMHVGGDYHNIVGGDITSKQNLEYNLRHGVKHLTAEISKNPQGAWDLDELQRMKDNCDKYGVIFEAIRMNSHYINLLRKGPKRDREIDTIVGNIWKAAQIGVKIITYHCEVIPYRRNGKTPGRGGTTSDSFKLEDDWKSVPMGDEGRVTHEDYWERITYFLEKIIPAARENDVRMACHPADPPGLPFGYQGVDQWDSPAIFEAIKRYESIVDSPYNGFQLDLGNAAAGLRNPATEVMPIVQYLGQRGKIHQLHMRNIRGGLNNFYEVFPDEGEVDFSKVMRILRDTQFSGSICPDHLPSHPDDPGGLQAFAFAYEYIKALIQAVISDV